MFSIFFRLILVCVLFYSLPINAADDYDELEPVIVSATRWETHGIPTASSITVITNNDIRKSGARNITEVLRGYGGVQISDLFGDGSRSTVSMRGFGANAKSNTLILVDGRRLNNTDLSAPDLSTISLKDVERIEIIQGSATILFGDQAVGGAINIITRREDAFRIEARADYGSYDTQSQFLIVNDSLENGLSYRFTGQRLLTDNYRDNNDREYTNAFGNIAFDWDRGNVFIEYQQVDEELELPGAIFINQVKANRKQTRFPDDFNDTASEIARIGSLVEINPHWQIQAEFTNRREKIEGVLTNIQFFQERHHQSLNPRVKGYLPFNSSSIVFGADLEKTDYSLVSLFGFGPGITNSTQNMESIYVQTILPFDDTMSMTIGLRKAWMDNDIVDNFSFPAGMVLKDDQFVSSFGITATPIPHLRFFLKREETYRFPLVDEETFVPFGTIGLKTQTGESYEAGLEWHDEVFYAKLVGYQINLENEIDFDPIAGSFGANTNLDHTERIGLIAESGFNVNDIFSVAAYYSYIDAEFSSGAFSGNKIPMVAKHQLRLSGNYSITYNLRLFGEFIAIDERVASGDFANAFQFLPGYGITNLNLIYHYNAFELSGRINNIFDKEYSDFAATAFNPFPVVETGFSPAPERNFMLTFSYNYE